MKSNLFFKVILSALFLMLLSVPGLYAQEENNNGWKFHVAPYIWAAGQKGTISLPGISQPVDVDLDFQDDIKDNLNGAVMLTGEAIKNRYGVAADLMFAQVETDDETPGGLWSSVYSRTESFVLSLTGFYRIAEAENSFCDLLAGIRYWNVDTQLRLTGNLLPGFGNSERETWIDPVLGLKGRYFFGESKWFSSANLILGGFSAGSRLMWDVNVNVGYQWTRTFALVLGYRMLDVDYEKGDYIYDVRQSGPLLGFSFRF